MFRPSMGSFALSVVVEQPVQTIAGHTGKHDDTAGDDLGQSGQLFSQAVNAEGLEYDSCCVASFGDALNKGLTYPESPTE